MLRVILTRLAVVFFLFSLGTFVVTKISNNDKVANKVMSYQEENQLGDELYEKEMKTGQNGRLLTDDLLDEDMDAILGILTAQLEEHHYNYTIDILDTTLVNAFSIPGGHLFYYSKFFEFLDSPEEFAAVLAHEMGHNENRHSVKRLIQTMGLNMLLALNPNSLNLAMENLHLLKYERGQEHQADEFAYQLMVKAGIHPKYFAEVMQNLDSLSGGIEPPEMLSDHPNTVKRMNEARNYPVPADFVEREIPVDWDQFIARLKEKSAYFEDADFQNENASAQ